MDLTKYYNKGFTGIENLGNTCFLNACVQVLNHTYELNEFLSSNTYQNHMKKDSDDTTVLVEWNDLRTVMWSGNGVVSPRKFVYNIHRVAKIKKKEMFTGYAQNDMPEFLLFIMECMHNSISRSVKMSIKGVKQNSTDETAVKCYEMLKETYSKEYSEIMDIFYGIYVSVITSKDGSTKHLNKPENYFVLDLPILDGNVLANNLYDCFNMFTKQECLEGENAWFNEGTGKKEDIIKKMVFWNFPKILIISLKRFTPDGQYKINKQIEFPLENLDLSSYVEGYNSASYVYDLYGVCNHYGGVLGGHYTAFVKNAQNDWIHFNDNSVEKVPDSSKIITPMAYCLFYRKKNNLL
jgi:ubiquitin carboxyl-terminal hydrolase 8